MSVDDDTGELVALIDRQGDLLEGQLETTPACLAVLEQTRDEVREMHRRTGGTGTPLP